MMNSTNTRLGVDIGGTFTDVALERDGRLFSAKVLTTYTTPELAIVEGMHQVCESAQITPSDIDLIIHGTTLATNALIERRGAKTALITTEGFRDVIEMRTESRFEQYDLNLSLPEPLLPRQRRYTVPERISAQGEVLLPLDEAALEELIGRLRRAEYESIAVGFLHSYLNDRHEKQVRDALVQRLPEVAVSLSCEVSPQMREYERFNTVVANAYIKPLMKSYLDRLQGVLQQQGCNSTVHLMHSGGGIIALSDAAKFPVRLVESGPAGGAVFAADMAKRNSLDKVLSFDMGGTTAKICLIKNHQPKTSRVFEVARSYRFKKGSGMPISIPVIDMVEIGAGGGSLARVDTLQQIRVGPDSASSEPGPACYGRGGEKPTVTDADLVLGKLDAGRFAGGAIKLDQKAAERTLKEKLGRVQNIDTMTAAFAVAEVVDEDMANAARVHAVENGEDLSEYTLIAFGGAAPLHAARLCEKLGIRRMLVPTGAGVGSAIGFLRAPISFEAARSEVMRLSQFDTTHAQSLLQELKHQASGFVRSCDKKSPLSVQGKAYMRYVGQGWEISVPLQEPQFNELMGDQLQDLFDQHYARLFGQPVTGMEVEVIAWSVNATTPTPEAPPTAPRGQLRTVTAKHQRRIFDPSSGLQIDAALISRDELQVGDCINGPVSIMEDATTIIVPAGAEAQVQNDGCVSIDLRPASE